MQDETIVELYFARSETAISETENKYAQYLKKIAFNILADIEDAREAVNETLLRAWNSIPPNRPDILRVYLAKITRDISIDAYRKKHRGKRIASEMTVSLDELDFVSSDENKADESLDHALLGETIERYLKSLTEEARTAFVQRYYYSDPIREIAARLDASPAKVKSMLFRTRQGLKEFLEKEGYNI